MLDLRTGKEMTRRETIKGGLGLAAILAAGKAPAMLLGARGVAFGGAVVSAKEYVQSGLIAMWDGIENVGWGTHNGNSTVWKNLISDNNITLLNNAHFDSKSFITDGRDSKYSGKIDALIPWSNIVHAEYQINVTGSSGKSRDKICSLSSTYRDGSYNMGARTLGWNNNNSAFGLMVKFNSVSNTGVTRIPNGLLSISINYGSVTPDVAQIPSFYKNGRIESQKWVKDGTAGDDGYIGSTWGCVHCQIRSIRYYSRTLTASEVASNYAVDKARFGLP